ncbi:MAG TPA: cytochrome d ubiquinol oxidase subunit II [Acidimicrobiia bacterium]|jgi:cytochrome d ubiquinol oxidase subunit II|nr:cytochrome d ubiquinol oxidase subunit II [Acidimicrobiia bacterium]
MDPPHSAALGITFRGSAFVFRKWANTVEAQRYYGAMFAGASAISPFFFGTIVGGDASGRVPLGNAIGDPVTSRINPTSLLGGVMAVVASAYLATVLLTREAILDDQSDHAEYFRMRSLPWAGCPGWSPPWDLWSSASTPLLCATDSPRRAASF